METMMNLKQQQQNKNMKEICKKKRKLNFVLQRAIIKLLMGIRYLWWKKPKKRYICINLNVQILKEKTIENG